MIRRVFAVLVIFACPTLFAASPQTKTAADFWDAIYLEGGKAGYVHTFVAEVDRQGQKVLRTTVDMHLAVKRFNQVVNLDGQTGTEETPEGRVLATFMRQSLGSNKQLSIQGVVKGKELELTLDGKANSLKPAPWDDSVVGLFRQHSMLADKKVQPGDEFSYLSFEPTVNLVVRMQVNVKAPEEVVLQDKTKVKLLRVETTPQKLQGVELPKLTAWVNEEWVPLRQDTELPGLGKITMYRTTKEFALLPGPTATLTDIGIGQFIRLNVKILRPYDAAGAVYRITVKGESDAAAAFTQDDRQKVLNAKGATFDMQVKVSKGPKKTKGGGNPGDEFTQSSYFINSADPQVKKLARQAVGPETDPWKKALRIEKWVNVNMRSTNDEALAPADQVARTLKGDCTEYAMLMAAMCRAEGVPSKTAMGMIYTDANNVPAMAFHMWTEVWIAGEWVPLDPTLGRGYVGATHLKVTDHSWHETRSLVPLLPLIRVLGKTQIEVVSVN
jgi:transglutaminase-like putative cysteine protease